MRASGRKRLRAKGAPVFWWPCMTLSVCNRRLFCVLLVLIYFVWGVAEFLPFSVYVYVFRWPVIDSLVNSSWLA